MNGNPTAAQKRFHEWCREVGCILTSGHPDTAIHHIKGAKMNLKGVKNPGDWYVIPLCYLWHQDPSNPDARHVNKRRFIDYWGLTEKEMWVDLIDMYESVKGYKPMLESEYQIILERA